MIQSHLRFPSYPSCQMTRLLHLIPSLPMIHSLLMFRLTHSLLSLLLDQLLLMNRCCPKHLCCLMLHCYRKIRSFPNYLRLHSILKHPSRLSFPMIHSIRWRRKLLSSQTRQTLPLILMLHFHPKLPSCPRLLTLHFPRLLRWSRSRHWSLMHPRSLMLRWLLSCR